MDLDTLREAFRPWMRISTRHTNLPEDDERFHRALKAGFEKFGPANYFEHFRQAVTDLAEDYHLHLDLSFKNDRGVHGEALNLLTLCT